MYRLHDFRFRSPGPVRSLLPGCFLIYDNNIIYV
nr:MAG TPA: hypothetical protein [Caudoviricetes sp.]DAO77665.1 MAG TPA: hypothetical protein [Caudoviricetes sp.]DAZ59673.1 MAG TPA: hypothetical protein [Caudoviricetes sp.]DAZ82257.1 MAG TPA: hypothetical protein [Caudoviricetes sp.]